MRSADDGSEEAVWVIMCCMVASISGLSGIMVCISAGFIPSGMETGGSSDVLDGVIVREDGRVRGASASSFIFESEIVKIEKEYSILFYPPVIGEVLSSLLVSSGFTSLGSENVTENEIK